MMFPILGVRLAALLLGAAPVPDTMLSGYLVGGLRVIQQIDTTTPLVAVQLYLLGGTQNIRPKTAGIEALLIGAAARGTRRYPRGEGSRALARVGALTFTSTDWDWSILGFEGLATDFDTAWSVIADRIQHPTLSDSSIEDERAALLSAARVRELDPEQRIQAIVESTFLSGHPYSLDPRGTTSSLTGITPDDVRQYAGKSLVASRMLLVVVGNVSKARVIAAVQATLGQLPAGTYVWSLPLPLPERDKNAQWIVQQQPLHTTYLLGYCTAPDATGSMYWPFRLFTDIYSGWLEGAIRGEGLSYAARAQFIDRARPAGGFQISTSVPDRAFKLAMDQMEEFGAISSDMQADEAGAFDQLIKQETSNYRFSLAEEQSTVEGRADVLARAHLLLGDYRKVDELVPKPNWFNPTALKTAAEYCHSTLELAYIGDTTRMHGRW